MMRHILTIVMVCAPGWAAAPSWLKEAATSAIPAYPAKTPAVVLLHEESVMLEPNGKQTKSVRRAVKVLTREGAQEARFGQVYYSDTGKPKEMKGWLIAPSQKVTDYEKGRVVDGAYADGLYEQIRFRALNASSAADEGAVFGVESVIEETSIFSQFAYTFQDELPVLRSRFSLTLPAGWRAEAKLVRGSSVEDLAPEVSGATYSWGMKALDPFEVESDAPPRSTQVPRILVSTFPPEGAPLTGNFKSWSGVSSWLDQLIEKSVEVTPEIESESRRIASGAASPWEKIRALAVRAQQVRYVSVQLNLSRGGGYTPRRPSMVQSKGYGDCKDKANYLRALLKAAGIESYPVVIYSGDPRRTRPEWPSPQQFNHAILAIAVAADTKAPAAFDYPGLGRLLLFDPTDEVVPFGWIPQHEQQSNALLIASEKGGLFVTPAVPASENSVVRTATISVDENGTLSAQLTDSLKGQPAFDAEGLLRGSTLSEYVKRQERLVAARLKGAVLENVEPKNGLQSFDVRMQLKASGYARSMQGRLMMVRPFPLPVEGLPDVARQKRTQPIVLDAASFREEVELQVPPGYEIDELPGSGEVVCAYGKYSFQLMVDGSKIKARRQLELPSAVVPAQDYAKIREFVGKIGGSEHNPVVFTRK